MDLATRKANILKFILSRFSEEYDLERMIELKRPMFSSYQDFKSVQESVVDSIGEAGISFYETLVFVIKCDNMLLMDKEDMTGSPCDGFFFNREGQTIISHGR